MKVVSTTVISEKSHEVDELMDKALACTSYREIENLAYTTYRSEVILMVHRDYEMARSIDRHYISIIYKCNKNYEITSYPSSIKFFIRDTMGDILFE